MSWLDRLRGRGETPPAKVAVEDVPACPHVTLVPRWDSAGDMGDDSKASEWRCDTCGATFSPAEAQALRATEAERLKSTLQTD